MPDLCTVDGQNTCFLWETLMWICVTIKIPSFIWKQTDQSLLGKIHGKKRAMLNREGCTFLYEEKSIHLFDLLVRLFRDFYIFALE